MRTECKPEENGSSLFSVAPIWQSFFEAFTATSILFITCMRIVRRVFAPFLCEHRNGSDESTKIELVTIEIKKMSILTK